MKIKIIGSTKVGYEMPKEEAFDFSGKSAGICYMPDTLDTILNESEEKTSKRANGNLKLGHHSVFAHVHYNLSLEGIPKILAMILNNEKAYNTSEKSARYTTMKTEGKEKELYEKWIKIYEELITKEYPNIDEKRINKLAKENARYLISVFTPGYTTMEYTVSFQQLNFIINWFEEYIENEPETAFTTKVKNVMKEFLKELPDLKIEGLNSKLKKRKLSFFATRDRKEEFGENYSVNYLATFSNLADAQRHRTISYEMKIPKEIKFYIPTIIRGTELEEEWKKDINSLSENFPQGLLLEVNERGTIENFVLKCTERLCGAVQLEVMNTTINTMNKYIDAVKDEPALYNYLEPYSKGPRCTFPGWRCTLPCAFGCSGAFNRKI